MPDFLNLGGEGIASEPRDSHALPKGSSRHADAPSAPQDAGEDGRKICGCGENEDCSACADD